MVAVDRIQGLSGSRAIKTPVRVATAGAIALSGEQTVDGVAVVEGDRVLVKDQASGVDNGIYEVSTGDWARTLDFDGANDATQGTLVSVLGGTVSGGLVFALDTVAPVIGTGALSFSRVFSSAPVTAFMETVLLAVDAAEAAAVLAVLPTAGGTVSGPTTIAATLALQQALEKITIEGTQITGSPTINFDFATQAILYKNHASGPTSDWTLNVRSATGPVSLDSVMSVGESATITVLVLMGATPYYCSSFTIDGAAVTPKWIGGTAPTGGDASCINVYTYTILKTAAATFTVLASKARTT